MIPAGFTSPPNLLVVSLVEMANLVDTVASLQEQSLVSSLNIEGQQFLLIYQVFLHFRFK